VASKQKTEARRRSATGNRMLSLLPISKHPVAYFALAIGPHGAKAPACAQATDSNTETHRHQQRDRLRKETDNHTEIDTRAQEENLIGDPVGRSLVQGTFLHDAGGDGIPASPPAPPPLPHPFPHPHPLPHPHPHSHPHPHALVTLASPVFTVTPHHGLRPAQGRTLPLPSHTQGREQRRL
jgi:hypothetical protein